ncbi:MFS general substrate transporter [Daedalea quercina L-15889]|uniref:MFS general substrate transporter n=1 Tax=Daedalea quercina L-15889 TaxID=1314783 RepID=A0A165M5T2_9APHY|nr:MFS general substrate transporter [Daedalea quercina L-15889]
MCIVGGWLVLFCTFGFSTSFGVFQDYYEAAGAADSSTISWIGSLQLFLTFSIGLVSGKWYDEGYFRLMSIIGTFLIALALFMLSICDPSKYYGLILTQGIVMGIGNGLLITPTLSIQSQYWDKKLGLALGIVQSGSSCGGIVMPIMLDQLFKGKAQFAWGTRAVAFLISGLLVIASFLMRARVPGRKAGPNAHKESVAAIKAAGLDVPYVLYDHPILFWRLLPVYDFYLPLWTRLHGMSDSLAFYTIAILNAGSVVGRIGPNALGDHIGPFNVLIPMCYASGILVFAMFGVTNIPAVVIVSFLYGLTTGSIWRICSVRLGILFFFTAFSDLFGTPIQGALLGADNTFWYKAILFSAVGTGSTFLIPARWMVARRRGTQLT